MRRRTSPATLPLVLLALLSVGGLVGMAAAETAAPAPVTEEVIAVEGAPNPLDAPVVGAGTVDDTILQSEVLWYAVDADPGQRVAATVTVVGRPDGPDSDDTALTVTLTDQQRQALVEQEVPFDGLGDAVVELPAAEVPRLDGDDRPLLGVALRSASGSPTLEGTGYRLQLTVVVDGTPLPPPTDPPGPPPPPPDAPDVRVTAAPAPPQGDPDLVRDLAPFALVALVIGGAAGFELSRRGL